LTSIITKLHPYRTILSYRDKRTEALACGEYVRGYQGFGTSAQFWLNLQSADDIRVAEEKAERESAAAFDPAGRSRCSQL
jgi:plasmid maintenance system antidote protein VapI